MRMDRRDLIERCYTAFNARDFDAVLAGLHVDVDWPNALDGGRLRGHDEVRRYWHRQLREIDPRVEPLAFVDDEGGRMIVEVHQVVRDLDGHILIDQKVRHVYAFESGLVSRMDIEDCHARAESCRGDDNQGELDAVE